MPRFLTGHAYVFRAHSTSTMAAHSDCLLGFAGLGAVVAPHADPLSPEIVTFVHRAARHTRALWASRPRSGDVRPMCPYSGESARQGWGTRAAFPASPRPNRTPRRMECSSAPSQYSGEEYDVLDENVARPSPPRHANLSCLGRYSSRAMVPAVGAGVRCVTRTPPGSTTRMGCRSDRERHDGRPLLPEAQHGIPVVWCAREDEGGDARVGQALGGDGGAGTGGPGIYLCSVGVTPSVGYPRGYPEGVCGCGTGDGG